jgi:hypothetical protein
MLDSLIDELEAAGSDEVKGAYSADLRNAVLHLRRCYA